MKTNTDGDTKIYYTNKCNKKSCPCFWGFQKLNKKIFRKNNCVWVGVYVGVSVCVCVCVCVQC